MSDKEGGRQRTLVSHGQRQRCRRRGEGRMPNARAHDVDRCATGEPQLDEHRSSGYDRR